MYIMSNCVPWIDETQRFALLPEGSPVFLRFIFRPTEAKSLFPIFYITSRPNDRDSLLDNFEYFGLAMKR